MDSALAANIAKGIWYRRKTGGMHSAKLLDDNRVETHWLHPNTLEESEVGNVYPIENFFCFYCRKEELR